MMGTKNHPGRFDCYTKADPDEPMFILLGRDRHAPWLLRLWINARRRDGDNPAQIAEAEQLLEQMLAWQKKIGKTPAAPYAGGGDAV